MFAEAVGVKMRPNFFHRAPDEVNFLQLFARAGEGTSCVRQGNVN
jgi:hypothetical protein